MVIFGLNPNQAKAPVFISLCLFEKTDEHKKRQEAMHECVPLPVYRDIHFSDSGSACGMGWYLYNEMNINIQFYFGT